MGPVLLPPKSRGWGAAWSLCPLTLLLLLLGPHSSSKPTDARASRTLSCPLSPRGRPLLPRTVPDDPLAC